MCSVKKVNNLLGYCLEISHDKFHVLSTQSLAATILFAAMKKFDSMTYADDKTFLITGNLFATLRKISEPYINLQSLYICGVQSYIERPQKVKLSFNKILQGIGCGVF
jgi:hypothetical protein